MSLLDLAGQLLGGGQQAGGGQALLSEVMGLVQSHPGGVGGLVTAFERGGLGSVAQSWVGAGQNLPVSADQIQSVLGSEKISALAARLGISPADASSHMAQLLPGVVDHLTPNAQVPPERTPPEEAPQEEGGILGMGAGLLKDFTNG